MCFDALHVDGRDLIHEAYAERRCALEELHLKQARWLTTPSLRGDAGAALYAFTRDQGWEGVVAKRLDSPYLPASRDGAWLKAKHPHARDLQVERADWSIHGRERVAGPLISYA
jgi:bifunctional non-homologous end joining protein LigD